MALDPRDGPDASGPARRRPRRSHPGGHHGEHLGQRQAGRNRSPDRGHERPPAHRGREPRTPQREEHRHPRNIGHADAAVPGCRPVPRAVAGGAGDARGTSGRARRARARADPRGRRRHTGCHRDGHQHGAGDGPDGDGGTGGAAGLRARARRAGAGRPRGGHREIHAGRAARPRVSARGAGRRLGHPALRPAGPVPAERPHARLRGLRVLPAGRPRRGAAGPPDGYGLPPRMPPRCAASTGW